jgi:hypothetical protein
MSDMVDDTGWEMDLTPGQRDELKAKYTPQQLMVRVAMARDYFRDYMDGGTYNGRPLEIKLDTWGRLTNKGGTYTYEVCFAGLWYLMVHGELLSSNWVKVDVPPIMLFLNALRFPSLAKGTIMDVLGVDVSSYPPEDWGRIDYHYILTFLDWLVVQSTPDQRGVAEGGSKQ